MKLDSFLIPRPGTLNSTRELLLRHAAGIISLIKSRVKQEADETVTTQFSEGAHAPTTMIRAAISRTAECEHGEVYVPVLSSHGWTVRALKHIKKHIKL